MGMDSWYKNFIREPVQRKFKSSKYHEHEKANSVSSTVIKNAGLRHLSLIPDAAIDWLCDRGHAL